MKQKELEFKQELKSHSIILEQKVADLTNEIKAKEASVRSKETQLIEDAKEKYGIDFQDIEQVA